MPSLEVTEAFSGVPRYVLWPLLLSVILLGAFILFYLSRASAQAPLRQAAGSRVALAIGEHFAPSDRFTGFVDENSGASIVVVELPAAAYEQFKRIGDTSGAFEAQGLINVQPSRLKGRAGNHLYLRGEQKTSLVDYAKFILIFPQGSQTVMLTANIPAAALRSGLVTVGEIEAIFRSAKVRPEAREAPALFRLDYKGPFEEDLSLLGTTKGYRLKSAAPQAGMEGAQPLFLVAPSLTVGPVANLGVLANRLFQTIEQVQDKVIVTEGDLTAGGLNGIEIVGSGRDAKTGEALLIYQVVLEAPHGGYFRLVGLSPENERQTYLGEFRKMTAGFHPGGGG